MSNASNVILKNVLRATISGSARSARLSCSVWSAIATNSFLKDTRSCPAANFLLRCRQSRSFVTTPCALARQKGPAKRIVIQPLDESWKKYDPNEGIPLPDGDLSQQRISEIAGPGLDVKAGNELLRILQWRRLSGTINDYEVSPIPEKESDRQVMIKALTYLRAKYPVNEKAAERAWAEAEVKRLEKELKKVEEVKFVYGPQQGPSKHSKSYIQEMMQKAQEEKRKRMKELERRREREMRKLRAEGKAIAVLQPPLALADTFGMQVQVKSPALQKYIERGTITQSAEPPKMSAWTRIWPTTLFTGIFISGCIFLANVYTPPDPSARLMPDTPPAIATCLGLAGLNVLVFLAWRWPPFYRAMNKYFLQCPGYPIAFSSLGSVVSHQGFFHLFTSVMTLMLFGPNLHEMAGRGNFVAIWFAGGVMGGWLSLVANVGLGRLVSSSLGASGANYGIIATYCMLNLHPAISTIFIPDKNIHIWSPVFLMILVVWDLYGITRYGRTMADHFSHLGGTFAGVMAGLVLQKSKAVESKRQADKKKQEMSFLKSTVR